MKVQFMVVAGQLEILPHIMLSLCAIDEEQGGEVADCSIWIGWLLFHIVIRFNE